MLHGSYLYLFQIELCEMHSPYTHQSPPVMKMLCMYTNEWEQRSFSYLFANSSSQFRCFVVLFARNVFQGRQAHHYCGQSNRKWFYDFRSPCICTFFSHRLAVFRLIVWGWVVEPIIHWKDEIVVSSILSLQPGWLSIQSDISED